MRAAIAQLKAADERQMAAIDEFIEGAKRHLDELQATYEAAGDPKAQAIQLLRSEGWQLTPPRR